MTHAPLTASLVEALRAAFGDRLQHGVALAPYTSARIGGPADHLLIARSSPELASTARMLWELDAPFRVLGGGSNILISDRGVREVVVLNQADQIRFDDRESGPQVWAESGASLGVTARRAVERGWSGLEWAATVPGTVGGAVVGNAGAHGGDLAGSLVSAEVQTRTGEPEVWTVKRLEFGYRDSWLKRHPGQAVVVAATLALQRSTPEEAKARVAEFVAHRQRTQPPGASMGSMFKNPPGDFAGRLLDQAGLKGLICGSAQISPQHANFFLNLGGARAAEVLSLLRTARTAVREKIGVELEPEVELVGDWAPEDVAWVQPAGGAA